MTLLLSAAVYNQPMQLSRAVEMARNCGPVGLSLSAGILGALALRLPHAWPLMFMALVPLLFASQKARTSRESFLAGTITGFCLSGAGSWWLFETLPLPASYGVGTNTEGVVLAFFSWLIASAATGAMLGLWSLVVHKMRLDRIWKYGAAVLLFLVSGILSLIAYNIVTAAPGVHNPLFYSAGFVGYALADNSSFLQAASVGGVWMLSGIVIFVNILAYSFCTQAPRVARRNLILLAVFLLAIALAPIATLRADLEKPGIKERVGFMSIGLKLRDTASDETFDHTTSALARGAVVTLEAEGAGVILLPEGVPFSSEEASAVSGHTIIHGDSILLPTGRMSLSAYATSATGDQWLRNKLALVPQGEYFPSLFNLLVHLAGAGAQADRFAKTHAFANGEIGNAAAMGPLRGALLFCSELLMPDLGRKMVAEQRANLLLFASSHSIFSGGGAIAADTLRYARVQTVEAGVPSVSSVVNDPAYALDRYGRITTYADAAQGEAATGVATVDLQ